MRRKLGLLAAAITLAGATLARAQSPDPAVLPASPIPKDAMIVFASDRDHEKDQWGMASNALYVADLNGHVTRITHSKFSHNHFEVSPNRRFIAVNRYSRGDSNHDGKYFPLDDWKELWIVDTVTGKERRIAPQIDAVWGGLQWAPDSKSVYFATPSATGSMDIVRVNIETEKVEVMTAGLNKLMGYDVPPGTKKWTSDVDLSADGKTLVFLYRDPNMMKTVGKPRVAVMKVDGSEAHYVSDGSPLPAGMKRGAWSIGDFDPTMSPDGKHVAWARVTDKGMVSASLSTFDIMVADLDGKNVRDVTPQDGIYAEFIPEWGKHGLIFTHLDPKKGMWPVVWDPATGKRTDIDIKGQGTHAQWIPDGPGR